MFTSNLIKNVFSLLVIVAVIFLSYRYITRPFVIPDIESGIDVVSADGLETDTNATENLANVFSNLLDSLADVDFQKGNSIFDNPIFQNGLVSFSRELPEIDRTRLNPFAPIEGNPILYIHYAKPAVTDPLTPSTTSKVLP